MKKLILFIWLFSLMVFGQTQIKENQIKNNAITRDKLNSDTTGRAVIKRVFVIDPIEATSTGVDIGTGDVTFDFNSDYIPYFLLYGDISEDRMDSLKSLFTIDTTSLSNRINTKLTASDTLSLSNRINLKFNTADTTAFNSKTLTTAQLNLKLNKTDTTAFRSFSNLKYFGTDNTTLAKNTNWGEPASIYYNGISTTCTSVATNDNLNFGIGDFSVEIFFKFVSVSATSVLLRKGTLGAILGYSLYLTGGKLALSLNDGAEAVYVFTSFIPVVNKDYHIVITVNRDDVATLFVNGVSTQSVSITSRQKSLTTSASFYIGGASSSLPSTSFVYVVRMYNLVLTQSEITGLYNNGRPDLAEVPYNYKWGSQTNLVTNGTFTGSASDSCTISYNKTYYFKKGNIDSVYFNSAKKTIAGLDTTFIATNINIYAYGDLTGSVLKPIGCVAEYTADNSTLTTWYDNSTNGLNGTHIAVALSNPNGWITDYNGVNYTSKQIVSTLATGTKPLSVLSSTLIDSLNADKADGYHFNQSVLSTASPTFSALTITNNLYLISTKFIYLCGNETTDGSWRIGATASSNLLIEYRVSGAWVAKQTLTP